MTLNCQLNFDLLDEFIGESKIAQGEAKAAQVESVIAQFLFSILAPQNQYA